MKNHRKYISLLAIAIFIWGGDSWNSGVFSASFITGAITCDNSLLDTAVRDGPVQIKLTNGNLSTEDGRLLYRYLPADGEKVIPYDNAVQPEYLRDIIRHWIPLCGDPKKTSDITGSFTRIDRGNSDVELGDTNRKYRQVNYNKWPLYYFDSDLKSNENAKVPFLWDLVPEKVMERKGKDHTDGNKYNAGP